MNSEKYLMLVNSISNLEEKQSLDLAKEMLDRGENIDLLIKACQDGIYQVGERYASREYFLTGLIMGGEIFKEVLEILSPFMAVQHPEKFRGKFLIGTVAGDIHDLGKNIVKMLLAFNKFEVFDLGVNVPAAVFVQKALEIKPDIIGLSGLTTFANRSMQETVNKLKKERIKAPVIIGGCQLDEDVFRFTGADYWVTDANKGVEICKKWVTDKSRRKS